MYFSVGDTLIDLNLKLPEYYCTEEDHGYCDHAYIEYDSEFHLDDKVRLPESDSLTIPTPKIAKFIWRLLNQRIESRKSDEGCNFYVRWGDQKFNVVEMNTVKELGLELLRLARDVEKEKHFLKSGKEHSVPEGIMILDEEDEDIKEATEQILYKDLYINHKIPLSTIERTIGDYTKLDNEQLYNFSHFCRQFFEDELHCVLEILNNQPGGKDKFIVYTPQLKDPEICDKC
jgi:hypothetical protein